MADSDRIPALDLLRGIAAVAVMVPHYFLFHGMDARGIWEAISISSVEVFFVLSGFVLGPQIILCAERCDLRTLLTFLARRWMRTIPSYIVALTAIALILHKAGSADFVRYATYTQNLFYPSNAEDFFPVAWSLSVEEWFYLLFPPFAIIAAVFSQTSSNRRYIAAAIVFIAGITLARELFGDFGQGWGENVRRVVIFRLDAIAYGFLFFVLIKSHIRELSNYRWPAFFILLCCGAALISANIFLVSHGSQVLRMAHPFISAAFGVSAVALFVTLNGSRTTSITRRLMLGAGAASYPIYLFHVVALYAASIFQPLGNFWIYSCVVIIAAVSFNYGFEQPLLAMRPGYRSKQDRSTEKFKMAASQ